MILKATVHVHKSGFESLLAHTSDAWVITRQRRTSYLQRFVVACVGVPRSYSGAFVVQQKGDRLDFK